MSSKKRNKLVKAALLAVIYAVSYYHIAGTSIATYLLSLCMYGRVWCS